MKIAGTIKILPGKEVAVASSLCSLPVTRGLLLALCLCAAPSLLFAADGGRAGEIFNYGAGARAISMGGAFTAVSGDAASVYYNPAGLGTLARPNVQLMHSTLFEGAYYDFMGYAGDFKERPGGWGLDLIRLASGDVEGRDVNNNKTSAFSYSETAFAAAGGIKGVYFPKLSMGASFKLLTRKLAYSSDRHFAFDLGMQYGPFARGKLDLGLVLDNMVSFAGGDTSDKLPLLIKAGAAYRITGAVMLAAEIDNDGEFRTGGEYSMPLGAVRLGFDGNAVSFGLGTVFAKTYSLDISVTRHTVLGMSTNISLGYQFGGAKDRTIVRPKESLETIVQLEKSLDTILQPKKSLKTNVQPKKPVEKPGKR